MDLPFFKPGELHIFSAPARRQGKTLFSELVGNRPRWIIFDEFSSLSHLEPLPPRVKDWKEQKPPEQIEQKKRPGVVMMRDRTGKLVERKLK